MKVGLTLTLGGRPGPRFTGCISSPTAYAVLGESAEGSSRGTKTLAAGGGMTGTAACAVGFGLGGRPLFFFSPTGEVTGGFDAVPGGAGTEGIPAST